MPQTHQHHIGGHAAAPFDGHYFNDHNPLDDSVYAQAALGSETDVVHAVETAHAAFRRQRHSSPGDREMWLLRSAELLFQRADRFIDVLIDEIGSPIAKAEQEVATSVRYLKAAAGAARHVTGKTLPTDVARRLSFSVRQPLGVIAGITPFNVPLIKAVKHSAMALATGNSVVLLPSEETPVLTVQVAQLYADAGLPDGMINVITGRGADIGDALTTHPLVRMVSFTGSTSVGRHIGELCGRHGKRCTLEMGGKNPLIVLNDADIEKAVHAGVFGSFLYQGQICMASSRIYVASERYPEFLEKFRTAASRVSIGDLRDRTTMIGPIINPRQRQRIRSHLDAAISQGATVVTGGTWTGNCCLPTILTNVNDDMLLHDTETFGPITAVYAVASAEEALAKANNSPFGLCASIFTADLNHALQFSQELQAGMVHINGSTIQEEPQVPFGGTGDSGFGREGTDIGIDELTEWKWITLQAT